MIKLSKSKLLNLFSKSSDKDYQVNIFGGGGLEKGKVYLIQLEFNREFDREEIMDMTSNVYEALTRVGITAILLPGYVNSTKITITEVVKEDASQIGLISKD